MRIVSALLALITVAFLAGCSTTSSHRDSTGLPPKPANAVLLMPPQSTEAEQAARRFLEAVKATDWDTVAKFWPPNSARRLEDIFTDRFKDYAGGLEIIDLGTPYKGESSSMIFVPYEVRFKNGDTQSNSLRIEQVSGGRWVWVGGF